MRHRLRPTCDARPVSLGSSHRGRWSEALRSRRPVGAAFEKVATVLEATAVEQELAGSTAVARMRPDAAVFAVVVRAACQLTAVVPKFGPARLAGKAIAKPAATSVGNEDRREEPKLLDADWSCPG